MEEAIIILIGLVLFVSIIREYFTLQRGIKHEYQKMRNELEKLKNDK